MKNRTRAAILRRVLLALFVWALVSSSVSFAALSFPYVGKFYNTDGVTPLTDVVNLTFSVLDPSGQCVLYQEIHSNVNLGTTQGVASLQIGSGSRTGSDPGLQLSAVLSNRPGTMLPVGTSGCVGGYSPLATDGRLLAVTVNNPTQGYTSTLSPNLALNAVPMAHEAQQLQGYSASDFILATAPVTQTNLNTLTDGSNADALHRHDAYVKVGAANQGFSLLSGQTLGLGRFTSATQPAVNTVPEGTIWINTDTNQITFFNGTQNVSLSNSGAISPSGFTGNLSGDVTGTQGATVVAKVGSATASSVVSAVSSVNAATSQSGVSTLVQRDSSGNFSANVINANTFVGSFSGSFTGAISGNAANFTGPLAGDVTGTQGATVVASVSGVSASSVAQAVNAVTSATMGNVSSSIVRRNASGDFSAGQITANLVGTASLANSALVASSAQALSGPAVVTSFVYGASASTGALFYSANGLGAGEWNSTATLNSAGDLGVNSIFSVGIISSSGGIRFPDGTLQTTASVGSGVASTANYATSAGSALTATTAAVFTGALSGDVTGGQSSTVVGHIGGATAADVATGTSFAIASTSTLATGAIVRRDANGNFSAGTITATLNGNAGTATTANYASTAGYALSAPSAGTANFANNAASADFASSANYATNAGSALTAGLATSANYATNAGSADLASTASFASSANYATNAGSALTATTAAAFSGVLSGDVTGGQSSTVVGHVGGATAADVATATSLATAATSTLATGAIVRRDASGDFSAGTITATLNGNANTATTANYASTAGYALSAPSAGTANFANNAASADFASSANYATNAGSALTAGLATSASYATNAGSADLASTASFASSANYATNAGSALTATTAAAFSGVLSGDVTGGQSSTVVGHVGGATAADVATATSLATAATSTLATGAIVRRDASGDFSAGTITATLNGNANTATTANYASTAGYALSAPSAGTANFANNAASADFASTAAFASSANYATNAGSALTAGLATSASYATNAGSADLASTASFASSANYATNAGSALTATTAAAFSGVLSGDVTGGQSSTVVGHVGGATAADVATATSLATAATSTLATGAIVRRDASGDFSAGTITATLNGNANQRPQQITLLPQDMRFLHRVLELQILQTMQHQLILRQPQLSHRVRTMQLTLDQRSQQD